MFIMSISSPVSREALEPTIPEAPEPVRRGGRILRQLRHWRAKLTSATQPGKRRREDKEPKTHGDAYEPGQPETTLIGVPDEGQLSLGFSPEHCLVLDLAVSEPLTTPSLSNGFDVTPASTPSAEILTFDDAATAPSAPSAPSTASSPRNSLRRVDRLSLCATLPVSPGHEEAPVLRQDEVDAQANILLLSLEDETASVIELDIQRQSFESNIVDPAFIPTTQLQEEEPQYTDNAPLDDLETIYEEDEEDEEACFALEDPVDVFTWDEEENDIAANLPKRPSAPIPFYFLEHDAPLATTARVREIDDMEPSSDSCDSSHYKNLFELIPSSNLSDSDNTEPTDDDVLSLVEPMEKLISIPEIQIDGIPLRLLDDAWSRSTSTSLRRRIGVARFPN
ncbi:hypothetical protein ACQY0O_005355 [Thecaphora frezii]